MDDDGIAEITATLRFDRAILLFWFLFKIALSNLSQNFFQKGLFGAYVLNNPFLFTAFTKKFNKLYLL
jgi:hypothetical protein